MKRIQAIFYTILVILVISLTISTIDYKGRMESAQEQRDFYFDALNQSVVIWQGYELAFNECTDMNKICNNHNKLIKTQLKDCKEELYTYGDMSEQGFYLREELGICR